MPRIVRLSLATAGVLVFVGVPTAVAAPAEETPEAEATSTSVVPTTTTTTAAPTTTPKRYVSRHDSEESTPTSTTTTAPTTTTTATAVPTVVSATPTTTPGQPRNGAFTAAAGRAGLSITVAGRWATVVPGAKSANGTLTLISVTSTGGVVGSPVAWTATASSTDFVGANGTIPKSAVTYEATAIAGNVGGSTSTPRQALDGPKTVVDRTGSIWPSETVTWTPALRVDYPDGAAVGSYTGTITISVA